MDCCRQAQACRRLSAGRKQAHMQAVQIADDAEASFAKGKTVRLRLTVAAEHFEYLVVNHGAHGVAGRRQVLPGIEVVRVLG